jgi:hypothetical protein
MSDKIKEPGKRGGHYWINHLGDVRYDVPKDSSGQLYKPPTRDKLDISDQDIRLSLGVTREQFWMEKLPGIISTAKQMAQKQGEWVGAGSSAKTGVTEGLVDMPTGVTRQIINAGIAAGKKRLKDFIVNRYETHDKTGVIISGDARQQADSVVLRAVVLAMDKESKKDVEEELSVPQTKDEVTDQHVQKVIDETTDEVMDRLSNKIIGMTINLTSGVRSQYPIDHSEEGSIGSGALGQLIGDALDAAVSGLKGQVMSILNPNKEERQDKRPDKDKVEAAAMFAAKNVVLNEFNRLGIENKYVKMSLDKPLKEGEGSAASEIIGSEDMGDVAREAQQTKEPELMAIQHEKTVIVRDAINNELQSLKPDDKVLNGIILWGKMQGMSEEEIVKFVNKNYPAVVKRRFKSGKIGRYDVIRFYQARRDGMRKYIKENHPNYSAMTKGWDIDAGRFHRAVTLAKKMGRYSDGSDDYWGLVERLYRQSTPIARVPQVVDGERYMRMNPEVPIAGNVIVDEKPAGEIAILNKPVIEEYDVV